MFVWGGEAALHRGARDARAGTSVPFRFRRFCHCSIPGPAFRQIGALAPDLLPDDVLAIPLNGRDCDLDRLAAGPQATVLHDGAGNIALAGLNPAAILHGDHALAPDHRTSNFHFLYLTVEPHEYGAKPLKINIKDISPKLRSIVTMTASAGDSSAFIRNLRPALHEMASRVPR